MTLTRFYVQNERKSSNLEHIALSKSHLCVLCAFLSVLCANCVALCFFFEIFFLCKRHSDFNDFAGLTSAALIDS